LRSLTARDAHPGLSFFVRFTKRVQRAVAVTEPGVIDRQEVGTPQVEDRQQYRVATDAADGGRLLGWRQDPCW